jgi:hypothetical protein
VTFAYYAMRYDDGYRDGYDGPAEAMKFTTVEKVVRRAGVGVRLFVGQD